jgi:hypothetical protein
VSPSRVSTTVTSLAGTLAAAGPRSYGRSMTNRIESQVTSLSWIPSEAVTGVNKAVFESGFTHYDAPPPDQIDDLEAMRDADMFRFANRLGAWIDVEDGAVVGAGYSGGCVMGSTTVSVSRRQATFTAVAFPDIQHPPELTETSARFVQTVGGHTALPAPRRVKRPPFLAWEAPTVWTTLALTIHSDGRVEHEIVGASAFPRHWVYGPDGRLCQKVGLADFKEWWRSSFGKHTPWGDQDSEALTTEVESALERELAGVIMRGGPKPRFRTLKPGSLLTEQGADGDDIYLLLNGVLVVEVDDEAVAEVGPGAIVGERAALEGGVRSSTLRAVTRAKVAVVGSEVLRREALEQVSAGHRREDQRRARS